MLRKRRCQQVFNNINAYVMNRMLALLGKNEFE